MADLVFIVLTVVLFLGLTALVGCLDLAVAPGLARPSRSSPTASADTCVVSVDAGGAVEKPVGRVSAR